MREKEENLNMASGSRTAMILLGVVIIPALLSSSSLGDQLSSSSLIGVVLLDGVILTLLSAITINTGEKACLPTYSIVKYSFGEKGTIAINILMAISLFGWIAVTANMSGHSVHDSLAQHGLEVPLALLVATGCVIFVASTAFDFTVLREIAQVAISVTALVLCYILYVATHTEVAVPAATVGMNIGVAVSIVVGTIIVLAAILPGFGSFVHDRKHALIAVGVTSPVACPLLYWADATPSAINGQGFLLGAMVVFDAVLPAALLLTLTCVTGNAGNTFQGALVVSALLTRFPKWQIIVALGTPSAIIGSTDIMAWSIPFLPFLGIAMSPIVGIYIADFLLYRRSDYQESVLTQESQIKVLIFVAWIIGAAVGFMTAKGLFILTVIPSADPILVACITYATLSRASQCH